LPCASAYGDGVVLPKKLVQAPLAKRELQGRATETSGV
jgi:hypothetical protein